MCAPNIQPSRGKSTAIFEETSVLFPGGKVISYLKTFALTEMTGTHERKCSRASNNKTVFKKGSRKDESGRAGRVKRSLNKM